MRGQIVSIMYNKQKILKVKNATQAVAERKTEKIQACGDSNHVLCCNGTGKDEDEITHIGIQVLFILKKNF